MNKLILNLTFLLILSNFLSAQIPDFLLDEAPHSFENKGFREYEMKNYRSKFNSILSGTVVKRGYDVLKYKTYFDLYNMMNATGTSSADRTFNVINEITLKIDSSNVSSIEFDAVNLLINSVKLNGNELSFSPNDPTSILNVFLPSTVKQGDTITIKIDYTYYADYNLGVYIYPKDYFIRTMPSSGDTVKVEERLFYTMSEPKDARYWLVSNDQPDDKALTDILVKVPKGFVGISNGTLDERYTNGDSTFFRWVSNDLMTTYLMAVTASKYVEWSDWYVKNPQNPTKEDSVEITYYAWEKDYNSTKTDGTEFNAKEAFSRTLTMMNAYCKAYIQYPFKRYGMVPVTPYDMGGMEHQTITTIHREWIRKFSYIGMAHELAHQWLGDLITCATWNDIWINEGGATWSEAVFYKYIGSMYYYNFSLNNNRDSYLWLGGLSLPAIYGLPVNTIFGDYAVLVYDKAGWVYHMLSTMLGDSLYYTTLRSMMVDKGYQSITTEDFKNYFKSKIDNPPVPFDKYFDQWIYKAGHPVFDFTITKKYISPSSSVLNIQSYQSQSGDNVSDVFNVPIDFLVYHNSGEIDTVRFIQTEKNQTFSKPLDFIPDSVVFLQDNILCEVKNVITNVKEIEVSQSDYIQIIPNPVLQNETMKIRFANLSEGNVCLTIYDELGRTIKTVHNDELPAGNYEFQLQTAGMPNGMYYLRIINGTNSETKVFSISK